MIEVKKEGILLEKTNLNFENGGVLNPAAIRVEDSVYLYYRAVRKGNHSTIGLCRLDGPLTVADRHEKPVLIPETENESHGVEDPRITKIDDLYYLTYTAYDGVNAQSALATSKDLIHFQKQGVIVPAVTYGQFVYMAESAKKVNDRYYLNHKFYSKEVDKDQTPLLWDKNAIFFPRRIDGKLVFLHRIRPGIQIAAVNELRDLTEAYWKNYLADLHDHIVMDPIYKHESHHIGGGCPPIETPHGWVLIYHGVKKGTNGKVYSACAALLDLNDPSKEIARLPYALFSPQHHWELKGEVNNVVFPTGTSLFGDTLFIYYGAADVRIACASVRFSSLVAELLNHKHK
ncbi:MAG TPA: pesticidal protein Cry7Aa [Candidatus Kapabacteria bacterium]|nr:pesticidal protein Cry7Aa [Candidatus Kapabacteria bacterium]